MSGGMVTVKRSGLAALDKLRPLWQALLERHAEACSVLPQQAAAESWTRRKRQYEGWPGDEGSFVLVAQEAGVPLGHIFARVDESDQTYLTGEHPAWIETLVVAAGERDAGVGGLPFDAALAERGRIGVDDLLVDHVAGNEAVAACAGAAACGALAR